MDNVLTERPSTGLILATEGDVDRYATTPDRSIALCGKQYSDNAREELLLRDLYEMYLQAVQQGASSAPILSRYLGGQKTYDRRTTFEEFLQDGLLSLPEAHARHDQDYWAGRISMADRDTARALGEFAEATVRRYLEKTHRQRLIGVVEADAE